MKLGKAAIIVSATVAIALFSCRKAERPEAVENNTISFGIERHNGLYSLIGSAKDYNEDEDLTMQFRSELMLPLSLGGNDVSTLRDSILVMAYGTSGENTDSIVEAYFTRCAKEVGYEVVRDTVSAAAADSVFQPTDLPDGSFSVRGAIVALTPSCVSVSVTKAAYYPRNAHGIHSQFFVNYDMEEGKVIRLEDLFTENGLAALTGSIKRKARVMSAMLGPTEISRLPQNGNFYITTDDVLVFVYQPYEVASYAQGEIAIPIEPYAVEKLLSPYGRKILLNE